MAEKSIITKKPLYFFLHIRKTGGTTLVRELSSAYGKGEAVALYRSPANGAKSRAEVIKYLNSFSKEEKEKFTVIAGHNVYYGLHELFPDREPRYIACFRQPVERTISSFNHRLRESPRVLEHFGQLINDHEILDLEKNLAEYAMFHNHTFKFLADRIFGTDYVDQKDEHYTDEQENQAILEKIKEILSHFYFLGITERSQDDFLFIADKLGVNRYPTKKNVSKKIFSLADNPAVKKDIEKYNLLDQEIYKYALNFNDNFKKNNSDFYLQVKKIKRKLILGSVICYIKKIFNPRWYGRKAKGIFYHYL